MYAEQLYFVYTAAFQNYKKAGKASSKESFITQCHNHENDSHIEYYGAFLKGNDELVGYSLNYVFEDWVDLSTLKFSPQYLSEQVSAALIYVMLCDYLNTQHKKYVSDGERSIRHVTNFQDYLIRYFGFRRAYCKLNIKYSPIIGLAVNVLYPLRLIISKLNTGAVINNIAALLDMEYIRRSF